MDIDLALLTEDAPNYDTSAVADRLVRGVADLYATMYMAQAAHWNVTGPDFVQLHALFGECYEQAYKAIDDVAEQARQLDTRLPTDLKDLLAASAVPVTTSSTGLDDDPMRYVRSVLQAEEMLHQKWNSIAEQAGSNAGLNDLASRLSGEHSKLAWKLRATLGEG